MKDMHPCKRRYTKRTTWAVSDSEGVLLYNMRKYEAKSTAIKHEGWFAHSVALNLLRPITYKHRALK